LFILCAVHEDLNARAFSFREDFRLGDAHTAGCNLFVSEGEMQQLHEIGFDEVDVAAPGPCSDCCGNLLVIDKGFQVDAGHIRRRIGEEFGADKDGLPALFLPCMKPEKDLDTDFLHEHAGITRILFQHALALWIIYAQINKISGNNNLKRMQDVKISAIAAVAENRVIGRDNALIWHIPEDLRHFKRITMGHPIVMGRKSYEALGKPLPGRPNIVISRSGPARPLETGKDGPFFYASFDEGIEAAGKIARENGLKEIFIIGGGDIYRQSLPLWNRLYLTKIHRAYEGDTLFPELDWNGWSVLHEEKHEGDPSFTFYMLERRACAD
jgi:dihydrofolate reductase